MLLLFFTWLLPLADHWSVIWNLEMLVFEERGKPEYQEKKSCQHKKKKCWHWKLNLGHIDGRSFSALTTILTIKVSLSTINFRSLGWTWRVDRKISPSDNRQTGDSNWRVSQYGQWLEYPPREGDLEIFGWRFQGYHLEPGLGVSSGYNERGTMNQWWKIEEK